MTPDVDRYLGSNKHDAINEFLEYKYSVGRSAGTIKNYANFYKRFFHEYYPDLAPEEVEIQHVEQFLYKLERNYDENSGRGDSVSQKTKRVYLDTLSSFYAWALERPSYPEINSNPANIVAEDIQVNRKPRPDFATWENACEVVRLIGDPRDKLAAAVMTKTGARIGEVLELKEEDLYLDRGFVKFSERKGGGETMAPIDAELVSFFGRFKAVRRSYGSEYLFVSQRGNRLSEHPLRDAVKDAAERAGVGYSGEGFENNFTPHTFRTVFTTLMRDEGMPDHFIKYIRGDSNERDILDWYTRIDPEDVRKEYLDCIKKIGL